MKVIPERTGALLDGGKQKLKVRWGLFDLQDLLGQDLQPYPMMRARNSSPPLDLRPIQQSVPPSRPAQW